jgi:two-component system LytT family sensor kinase
VNPHFLFNALNTIAAVTRTDAPRARELILHLAALYRKNLKRPAEIATLREELEHVGAYLEIEKARFSDRLTVEIDVDESLNDVRMPAFTLQPLVENAFKHGLSQVLGPVSVRLRARRYAAQAQIEIEDSAGTFQPTPNSGGLGLRSVDTRIKNLIGPEYGVDVSYVAGSWTRVTVRLPLAEAHP